MSRLWNGRPFRNFWNEEISVEKKSEYLQLAKLDQKLKNFKWEDIETHHQAMLRDVFRSVVE